MKILICTAWVPTKTEWFAAWSKGITNALRVYNTDLFITSYPAESKFRSIVGAMREAEIYALAYDYDYLFNVEADFDIGYDTLERLLKHDKDVLLPGVKHELKARGLVKMDYQELIQGKVGWGVMLVKTCVLRRCPFQYHGDFITPDRAWFKKVLQENFEVWRDYGTVVKMLETSTGAHASPLRPLAEKGKVQ